MADMTVTSTDFADGDYIDNHHVLSEEFGFGSAGNNQSPQLSWTGAPEGTKSFAITCYDPDAPTGSGFWHWVVANVPPDVATLNTGAGVADGSKLPPGAVQVRSDYGFPGYGGPCPPKGDHPHRYIFTVHAVGVQELAVDDNTTPAIVGFQLHFNTLAKGVLMGLFKH